MAFGVYAFTSVLINNDVTISIDGRGQALDNIFVERLWRTVSYEEAYLKQHDTVQSLLMGLTDYFVLYNQERYHQSLGYKAPDRAYQTAIGGGAQILESMARQKHRFMRNEYGTAPLS
ncbi:MAG: hypothetical protein EXR90_06240 [Methyloglobulus sp.]|nr:hypothetical protein [Methyloglobulus sp.]